MKMLRLTTGLGLIVLTLLIIPASGPVRGAATPIVTWSKTFACCVAYSAEQTFDGGFIVVGNANDHLGVLRLNATGGIVWQHAYGASLGFVMPPEVDEGFAVQQTSDGGFVVAGDTNSLGAGGLDAWVLRLDSLGNVTWQQTYGGSGDDIARSVHQTSDGGFILAGSTSSFGAGGSDVWVLKLNMTGGVVWQKTYGGAGNDFASSVEQTSDGGFIVAGRADSFGAGGDDVWVLKLDNMGNPVWQKTYGGKGDDLASSIDQTSDGGFIVAGSTRSFGASFTDAWVLRLDASGGVVWQKMYGGTRAVDFLESARQTSDGGFIVAGQADTPSGSVGAWVFKLDANGRIVWQNTYSRQSPVTTTFAHSISQTSDGGFIVAGDTNLVSGSDNILVMKLDPNGNIGTSCNLILPFRATVGETDAKIASTTVTGVTSSATVTTTSAVVSGPIFPTGTQC